jgi:hypothetical protein
MVPLLVLMQNMATTPLPNFLTMVTLPLAPSVTATAGPNGNPNGLH